MKEGKTNQTVIYEAADFMPKTLDTLLPNGEDKVRIVISKYVVDEINNNARIWILSSGETEYFTASKYVIETLQMLDKVGVMFPFGINLIRKESKDGNEYFMLKP